MIVPDAFVALARANAHRQKLKFKRGNKYAKGWHKLGSGWFGEVWEHDDYPGLVMKVSGRAGFGACEPGNSAGTPSADSWQVYAQYCHKHPHEHLPQILHFERINASVAWAIMPKYKDGDGSYREDKIRLQWQDWLNGGRGAPEWLWPIIAMAKSLGMAVDLHRGNVMVKDDGTLVMTDPFSGLEET